MKKLIAAFVCGALSTLGCCVYQGGEWISQQGARLTAATITYDFVASPRLPDVEGEAVAISLRKRGR